MVQTGPLAPEPVAYLRKSAENLDDARAALAAGRHNAAANRSYYAAFHAAVAALWVEGIRPRSGADGTLSHQMVRAEWSGRLVQRRKLYPPELRATLHDLSVVRYTADYRVDSVTRRQAQHAVAQSEQVVRHVEARLLPARSTEGVSDGTPNR